MGAFRRTRYNPPMAASPDSAGPVTVALVGAGHRTMGYAGYALRHPDRMKVVAVAEPDPVRREAAANAHAIPLDRRFATHREMLAGPRVAEAVINGTMDRDHFATALPLLEAGYHMLLEKPIAPTEDEVRKLIA